MPLVRSCDSCGLRDDHPRHVHLGNDGSVTTRHFDCCHNAGCPGRTCTEALRLSGRARGHELRAFLTGPEWEQQGKGGREHGLRA